MVVNHSLPHQSILECLHSESFRSRYGHVSPDAAEKVSRFGAPLGSRIEHYPKIFRCMARIRELINETEESGSSLPSGTIVLAEELKGGSGRFDREWFAPAGGIWMALAWADTLLPDYARLLPLAAGTACCETIRNFGVEAMIKWVNDIHVNGRKLGGILCETLSGSLSGERYHIIGIGINCNISRFPEELRESAVSMQDILGTPVDLKKITVELMAALAWNFGLVHYQEGLELVERDDGIGRSGKGMVLDAWLKVSDTIGRKVLYGYDVVRQPIYQATVRNVERSGALVMELQNGETVTEHSGEIIYLN